MNKLLTFVLVLSICITGQCQIPLTWTWINGDAYFSTASYYGVRGVESPLNKPPAREWASTWTDLEGNLWLFGGNKESSANFTHNYNDLWKYNISTNRWTWVNGDTTVDHVGIYGTLGIGSPQNKPGGRSGAASWIDAEGNFWLFGGLYDYGGLDYGSFNDMWKYNPVTNIWTWMKGSDSVNPPDAVLGTQGIPNIQNTPGGIGWLNAWTGKDGNFWLFGGLLKGSGGIDTGSNLLWKYNPVTNEWTWMKGSLDATPFYSELGVTSDANTPGSLSSGTTWVDTSGTLWIFGGAPKNAQHSNNFVNELWKYDPSLNSWTWIRGNKAIDSWPTGLIDWPAVYGIRDSADVRNMPGSRATAVGWNFGDDNLWLFGGLGVTDAQSVGTLNDLWRYNIGDNKWTWVKGDTILLSFGSYGTIGVSDTLNNPPSREYSCGWVDHTGTFWMFGSAYYNDLWSLNAAFYNHKTELEIWAEPFQDEILVSWKTNREINTDHFELEKAENRIEFTEVFNVEAAGTSLAPHNYSYLDTHPLPDSNFFRVKIVNTNGDTSYSNIVAVKLRNKLPPFVVYPNPVYDILHVQLNGNNERFMISILNVMGQKISESNLTVNGTIDYPINVTNLPKAMYILVIRRGREFWGEKFIML